MRVARSCSPPPASPRRRRRPQTLTSVLPCEVLSVLDRRSVQLGRNSRRYRVAVLERRGRRRAYPTVL